MNRLEHTERTLDLFGRKVVSNAKAILSAKGKKVSGELMKGLGYSVKVEDGEIILDMTAPGYARFVDKGVKGSKSSALAPDSPYQFRKKNLKKGVVDKWVVRKGLKGVRDKKGRFVKRKTLTYLIGRKIALYGIKPTNFFTDAFNQAYSELPKEVAKAYKKDLQAHLDKLT